MWCRAKNFKSISSVILLVWAYPLPILAQESLPAGNSSSPSSSNLPFSNPLDILRQPPPASQPTPSFPGLFRQLPVSPTPPLTPLPTQELPYTLGPGDAIALDVLDVPEYSKVYGVGLDGTITLPLLKRVLVKGLTVDQVESLVTRLYAPLLSRPNITVNLTTVRPFNISVVGQVASPGAYQMGAAGTGKFPTLVEALTLAKGVTTSADISQIRLYRVSPSGMEEVYNINLQEFLVTGDLRQNVILRDGDRIFVPTTDTINTEQVRLRAGANFVSQAQKPLYIVMIGEVKRPGPYTIAGEGLQSGVGTGNTGNVGTITRTIGLPTVTAAIQNAGGITQDADIRKVEVRRRSNGFNQEQVLTVNLWDLLRTGKVNEDPILQDGDTVVIPKADKVALNEVSQLSSATFSPTNIQVNVVGEVPSPGAKTVPPNTSLNQALLSAGGFDRRRAKKDSVQLVRLNPDGTAIARTIQVDLNQGLDEQNNPILRENDVIIVGRSVLTQITDTTTSLLQPFTGVFGFFQFLYQLFPSLDPRNNININNINNFRR